MEDWDLVCFAVIGASVALAVSAYGVWFVL